MCGINGIFGYGNQAPLIKTNGDGESGFFVEKPSIQNIKEALQHFLNGELSFNNHTCRHFAEQFTWQRVVDEALPFYLSAKSL